MPVKSKEKRKENRRKYRDNKSKMCLEYKGGKCEDCGIVGSMENRSIFDFHHPDPNVKGSTINTMLKDKVSTEKLKQELDKCVLLCANCHRLRHQHYKEGLRDTL
jgi:hypothetical protein